MKSKSTTSEEALVARGRQQSQIKGRRGRSKFDVNATTRIHDSLTFLGAT